MQAKEQHAETAEKSETAAAWRQSEAERLSAVVLHSLDQEEAGDLPRLAYKSRSQFFRLFQALIEETPGAMRRRLLLERAAWQLSRTQRTVTEIAFDANYGSLEAFTRAFRHAYRISPSLYRRMGATHYYLHSPNGIHFCKPAHETRKKGENAMDLFDFFNGADAWHNRRLLQYAQDLTDEQLDRPLNNPIHVFPWDTPDQSLREILERMVYTKEVWNAAVLGRSMPASASSEFKTPAALLKRFELAEQEFGNAFQDVKNRGAWDDTFVDALCEPAETFTFGGMFAHVMTFNGYRRLVALDALRKLGVKVEGFGCPSEYEASLKVSA